MLLTFFYSMRFKANLLFFCISVLLLTSSAMAIEFAHVEVTFKQTKLNLHLAETPEQRAQGLQHVEKLCPDCGMIFRFPNPKVVSFWMKNTQIPLDIAFIDQYGEILQIELLTPFNLESVRSDKAVKYAWEMNSGWFERSKLNVGDKVTFQY